MSRAARILAVLVSAVLGVAGGVTTGLLVDRAPAAADPLGLGIPLVDQACTWDSIVMLSWGDPGPGLSKGITEAPPGEARYLDTRHSCPTFYTPSRPRYVTYVGPFPSLEQACHERMRQRYAGDIVTRLHRGNDRQVECACYVAADAPDLRPGAEPLPVDTPWIRSLQRILHDLGLLGPGHLTGVFDPATQRAVQRFQQANALYPSGAMTSTTWNPLLTQGCKLLRS